MQDCPELQRVTTEYVARHDRMRLSGAASNGDTVVLWLTQRMLNLFLPRLTQWLERQSVASATAGVVDNQMLQGFAQEAARNALPPQPAVRAESSTTTALVDTVDMGISPTAITLTFKDGDARSACLTLGVEPMRQWLDILYDQYLKGGWPTTCWPLWMEEARRPVSQTNSTPMH